MSLLCLFVQVQASQDTVNVFLNFCSSNFAQNFFYNIVHRREREKEQSLSATKFCPLTREAIKISRTITSTTSKNNIIFTFY